MQLECVIGEADLSCSSFLPLLFFVPFVDNNFFCFPRETSPRSFHSPRSVPQVARCREASLRVALPTPRRPGVIHGVTPPGSVLYPEFCLWCDPFRVIAHSERAAQLDDDARHITWILLANAAEGAALAATYLRGRDSRDGSPCRAGACNSSACPLPWLAAVARYNAPYGV